LSMSLQVIKYKKPLFTFLFAIALILFISVHAVDDINRCMNIPYIRQAMLNHFQDTLKGSASAREVRIYIGFSVGVALHGSAVEAGENFRLTADEIDLFFSVLRRIRQGHWLRSIRLIRPKIAVRSDWQDIAAGIRIDEIPVISVRDPDVTLYYQGHVSRLQGDLTGRVSFSRVGAGKKISANGTMNIGGARVSLDGGSMEVRGLIRLKGRDAQISELAVSAGTVSVQASGDYRVGVPGRFSGKVQISGLEVHPAGGKGSPILNGLLGVCEGEADITFIRMKLFGIPVDSASGRAEAKRGILYLKDMRTEGGGPLSGSGTIVLRPGSTARFDVDFSLRDYDIESALHSFPAAGSWVDGTMNLRGRIWGTADSVNGDLFFSTFNGRLKRYTALAKIFGAINIYKQILNINPEMTSRGFPYNSILANVSIHDSVVRIDNLYLDSNSVQLSATGTYSLRTRTIDAMLGLMPLESLDVVIGNLPVLGWIVKGNDKGLVVIDLKVEGSIDDLRVRPAPVHTISRKAVGILLRTLTLPYVLFTNPGRLIPGLPKKK
jgi:hypothetical protein